MLHGSISRYPMLSRGISVQCQCLRAKPTIRVNIERPPTRPNGGGGVASHASCTFSASERMASTAGGVADADPLIARPAALIAPAGRRTLASVLLRSAAPAQSRRA